MSIQRSLILTVVLTLLLPAFLVSGWQTSEAFSQMERRFAADQDRTLDSLVWSLTELVWNFNEADTASVLRGSFYDERIVRISVTSIPGTQLAEVQNLSRDHGRTVSVQAPIKHGNQEIGSVSLSMDRTPDFDAVMHNATVTLALLLVQLAFSVSLLLWQLRRRFVQPLRLLELQAQQLNRNQLGEAFVWTRNDELGHLGASLEATRLALKESFSTLEARVSERTRDLEAFSYSVSHDLRAPLRAIKGYADALTEDVGSDLSAQALEDLKRIHRGVGKMGQLIEDLLNLSMVTRVDLKKVPVNLLVLAKSVWNDLEEKEPLRKVKIEFLGDFHVEGDIALLEIALRNLLGNAWKYTSKTAEPEVWLEELKIGNDRWFALTDNGPGFPPERAEELFEPFLRLHSDADYAGNGIGLAIVKRIIDRHGGQIMAEALPEGGARFKFSLATRR